MCGQNSGSSLKYVNGVSVSTASGGSGGAQLRINSGHYAGESSDWAVSEVIVWDRALPSDEFLAVHSILKYYLISPCQGSPMEMDGEWVKVLRHQVSSGLFSSSNSYAEVDLPGSITLARVPD